MSSDYRALQGGGSHSRPQLSADANADKNTPCIKLRTIIVTNIDERLTEKSADIKEQDWINLEAKIEDPNVSNEEKKCITKWRNNKRRSYLMLACIGRRDLKIVKLLVEIGGNDILNGHCNCGFNALHYACWSNASPDIIKYLVNAKSTLVYEKTGNGGANALHIACQAYDIKLLPIVIRLLIKAGKQKVVTATNSNSELPLHGMLIRAEAVPVEAFKVYLDEWYEVLQEYKVLQEKTTAKDTTARDTTTTEAKVVPQKEKENFCHSFNKTLGRLREIPDKDQGEILRTKLLTTYLTHHFTERLPLALIMVDLYVQVIVICAICVSRNEQSYLFTSFILIHILPYCTLWQFGREIVQAMARTTSYCQYLSNVSNWVDIGQLGLLIVIIKMNYIGDVMIQDHNRILVATTFMAWIKLLFILQHLIFELAVFVHASVEIVKHLIPFCFTTIIFVLMFAQMYFVAGPDNINICENDANANYDNEDMDDFEENEEFDNKGGWACTLTGSLTHTFEMFVDPGIPSGVPIGISLAFAFVMSVFLLNILIAVISTKFDEVINDSRSAFLIERLVVVDDCQNYREMFFWKKWEEEEYNRFCKYEKSDDEQVRFDFNCLMETMTWRSLKVEDQDFFHWWYGKDRHTDSCPPPLKRLSYFFQRSRYKDILYPGVVFQNILLGRDRSFAAPEWYKNVFCFFTSFVLMVVSNFLIAVVFLAGLLSLGILWPKDMKEKLFTLSHLDDENERSQNLEKMKKDTTNEVEVMIEELGVMSKKMLELLENMS